MMNVSESQALNFVISYSGDKFHYTLRFLGFIFKSFIYDDSQFQVTYGNKVLRMSLY
jgi:hypothetical protein